MKRGKAPEGIIGVGGTEVLRRGEREGAASTGENEPGGLVTGASAERKLIEYEEAAVGDWNGFGNPYDLRSADAVELYRGTSAPGSAE